MRKYLSLVLGLLLTLNLHCNENESPSPEVPVEIRVPEVTSEFERTWFVFITAGLFAAGLFATNHHQGKDATN